MGHIHLTKAEQKCPVQLFQVNALHVGTDLPKFFAKESAVFQASKWKKNEADNKKKTQQKTTLAFPPNAFLLCIVVEMFLFQSQQCGVISEHHLKANRNLKNICDFHVKTLAVRTKFNIPPTQLPFRHMFCVLIQLLCTVQTNRCRQFGINWFKCCSCSFPTQHFSKRIWLKLR